MTYARSGAGHEIAAEMESFLSGDPIPPADRQVGLQGHKMVHITSSNNLMCKNLM
jgi:hypothetical protein